MLKRRKKESKKGLHRKPIAFNNVQPIEDVYSDYASLRWFRRYEEVRYKELDLECTYRVFLVTFK